MNPSIYLQIQNGTVINAIICLATDTFDPAYTWVIAGPLCTDGVTPAWIGCTYDGTNFYAAT